jgi:glycerol-1-phosphate dehydrogenase [NAD(P)+]
LPHDPLIYIGPDAIGQVVAYADAQGMRRFHLVADENTWAALGQRAWEALRAHGAEVTPILLMGAFVAADEEQIVQLMLPAGGQPDRVYLAVGAGTITDITRFASHRMGRPFISLPTAPSVDAYTSINAPLLIRRLKETINAQAPLAVFADLETLRCAPRPMIAAGFGDMVGKYTCLADWRLGHILWDEPYDAEVAAEAQAALEGVVAQVDAIGALEPQGIVALMEALCASGLAMVRVGNSSPASASEHHLSHFWEGKLLQEGRPALLHGAKVGVAAVMMAAEYARLRALSRQEAAARLARTPWPSAERQQAEIRAAYGRLAEGVIAAHRAFIEPMPERLADLRARIVARWDEIQAIAITVPPPEALAELLRRAGGPTTPQALGLGIEEIAEARRAAHYIRSRFTVRKLEIALGIE